MKSGKTIKITMVASLATVLLAAGLYASSAPDVISMEEKAYKSHGKGIVQFSHGKHAKDYGATCGECHHDAQGKPLAALKDGDPVHKCIECHKTPGEVPKDMKKDMKKMSKDEQKAKELEYHAEALHMNCRDCHKDHNKEKGLKGADGAPTSCAACHPKK